MRLRTWGSEWGAQRERSGQRRVRSWQRAWRVCKCVPFPWFCPDAGRGGVWSWSVGKVIGECGFAARDADPEASGANLDLGKPCPSEAEAPLVLTLSLWE